jgi:succinate dehydrogenase/fumarate reductase flavoprotein subunit
MMKTRRRFFSDMGLAGVGLAVTSLPVSAISQELNWDLATDVLVAGAGAAGLPAAIEARELGADVLVVDANFDVGGHAIVNAGQVALGGGHSIQRKHGVNDSPDLLYSDLTDWSVVQPNGFPEYRYNDRDLVRAYADHAGSTVEWLIAHGVVFVDKEPEAFGISSGNSAPRGLRAAATNWPLVQTGKPVAPEQQTTFASGVGLIRPLEASARKLGVKILLEHRLKRLVREHQNSGRVLGAVIEVQGAEKRVQARKGVIVATGGSSGNVNFRRIFDPRLTEEYDAVGGEPYSVQDASGEIAAMSIGASLWGAYNQIGEFGLNVTKPGQIGTQYGYATLIWEPTSPIFNKARAVGLHVKNWQNLILVNQAGKRFYDETAGRFIGNYYNAIPEYASHSNRNLSHVTLNEKGLNFFGAALAGDGKNGNGGGPIWAIFDSAAVERERWKPEPPNVDTTAGYFFSAPTLEELAAKVVMKHQPNGLPAKTLAETVERFNSFVDAGKDADFDRPTPPFKILQPPFYAAWATPVVHDTRVGIRINRNAQVLDLNGEIITGLYSAGECAGGLSQHGVGRCLVLGRIAGAHAADGKEPRS